jgi:putative nucleotidyltransferase with HDIG domain
LYHDIGKLQKSDYFVENQEARMNRHDRLSPTMSLLIIFGHVKDGIEMARAYGVPRILHQFIAEHHGTTVVKYFHHAASEAAAKNVGKHDRTVAESEFRYPGPKPRSKESAILMVCDTCEGAVRALSEPTPGRIEAVVHQMMMERLNDGQFDDCDITLKDLKLVEESVVKNLCALHHGRIKYPKAQRSEEEQPSETDARSENGRGIEDQDAEPEQEPAAARQQTPEAARQA